MNDALKLLSRALKPLGYCVRRLHAPNLLRIRNLEKPENAENVGAPRLAFDDGFFPVQSDLSALVIFWRFCLRSERNIDTSPRITGTTLEENTLRCLRSLTRSVQHALRMRPDRRIALVALDDRSDPDYREKIDEILKNLRCSYEIRQTHEPGQGSSLHQQFSEARSRNALIYCCEDDYLHEEDAINTCWDFYESVARTFGTHCLIYPQEHPVMYNDLYPSYLLKGIDRHWRTVRHSTHTFLTHGLVVDRFWDYFENTKFVGNYKKRKLGSESRTTNKLFLHIPGFSPLRPAAVHLQFQETLPPLYDWRPLWNKQAD